MVAQRKLKLISKIGKGENGSVWWANVNGKRRVVKRMRVEYVKVYVGLHTKSQRNQPLRGVALKHISCMSSERDEDSPYIFHFGHQPYDKDGADILILGNTFYTEKAVGECLKLHVNSKLPAPTFCIQHDSWKSESYYNISMEYAGVEMSKFMSALTLDDIKSIVYQILIAMAWAQEVCHFKHHDMHPGNIFLEQKEVPLQWTLPDGTTMHVGGKYLARIADFGLSAITNPVSCTRHARIDYELNSISHKSWGKWDHVYEGNKGYDVAVFLGCLKDDVEGDKKRWVNKLLRELGKSSSFKISNKGRPSAPVLMSAHEFLHLDIFKTAEESNIECKADLD
jgi:hypothetical protein